MIADPTDPNTLKMTPRTACKVGSTGSSRWHRSACSAGRQAGRRGVPQLLPVPSSKNPPQNRRRNRPRRVPRCQRPKRPRRLTRRKGPESPRRRRLSSRFSFSNTWRRCPVSFPGGQPKQSRLPSSKDPPKNRRRNRPRRVPRRQRPKRPRRRTRRKGPESPRRQRLSRRLSFRDTWRRCPISFPGGQPKQRPSKIPNSPVSNSTPSPLTEGHRRHPTS